jgi:hypothetical protein
MSIEISHETEARLADEARRQGVSVETLLKRFIEEQAALTQPAEPRPELPVWHLGAPALFTGATSTTMPVEPGIVDANVLVRCFQNNVSIGITLRRRFCSARYGRLAGG